MFEIAGFFLEVHEGSHKETEQKKKSILVVFALVPSHPEGYRCRRRSSMMFFSGSSSSTNTSHDRSPHKPYLILTITTYVCVLATTPTNIISPPGINMYDTATFLELGNP